MATEILIVVVLIIINGLLAMSELAVVSSRPARLKVMRDAGSRGAATALALADAPGRFLSTVQIGITLVGVLSGAFSGATLGGRLATWLRQQGLSDDLSASLGVGIVVVLITYLSLIIGELVPKQIALRDAEKVAARVAPAMQLLSRLSAPLVWLLDLSGTAVLRLLGQKGQGEGQVTEEEVKSILAEAESAGVLESEEKDMISGVMRLSDRMARALMTPRGEVEVIDLSDEWPVIRKQAKATRHSRLPVQSGNDDTIIGIIHIRDLISAATSAKRPDLMALVQPAPVVSDRAQAFDVLKTLRAAAAHMVMVFDEYGHFEGIITSDDILEAITGVFQETEEPAFVVRDDGSFLVAGWMPIDEFAEKLGAGLPRRSGFATVAGYVLDAMQRIPRPGEWFDAGDWRIEVLDLDGRRIDKLLVSRIGSY